MNNFLAFYGSSTYQIDITHILKTKCMKNNCIQIISSYNDLFGDVAFGIPKSIYIKFQNIIIAINENTPIKII